MVPLVVAVAFVPTHLAVAGFLTEVSADPDLLRRLRQLLREDH